MALGPQAAGGRGQAIGGRGPSLLQAPRWERLAGCREGAGRGGGAVHLRGTSTEHPEEVTPAPGLTGWPVSAGDERQCCGRGIGMGEGLGAWAKAWGPGQPGASPGLQRRGPGLQRGHGLLPRGPGPGDAAEAAVTSGDQRSARATQRGRLSRARHTQQTPGRHPHRLGTHRGGRTCPQPPGPVKRATCPSRGVPRRVQRPAASPAARAAGVADQEAAGR